MNQVTATVEFDQEKGIVKFSMDLQGNTELDHELLAAAIGDGRKVFIRPAHKGEELFAEFVIDDEYIWPDALHNLENRHRVRDGKPTLEQEASMLAAQKKAADDAAKAPKPPTAEERMEQAIASGIATGLKAAGVAAPASTRAPKPADPPTASTPMTPDAPKS
jgi:hypothetical protein